MRLETPSRVFSPKTAFDDSWCCFAPLPGIRRLLQEMSKARATSSYAE